MIAVSKLQNIARTIRARIVTNSHYSHTPHLGSCLSCVDILVAAYFYGLLVDPENPKAAGRDRFVLSKGHAAPALFQVLAMRGFYSKSLLDHYGCDGGVFAEHPPTPDQLPGIEAATGALGHGLPIALGMALAARVQKKQYNVVALLGDGECNEGSIWEAAMMASSQKISNLMVFIDYNKWQATGRSNEVLGLSPLAEKWRAFGWDAHEVDGHDIAQLTGIWDKKAQDRPAAVIAHTIKGKGVSFMEDDNNWHYRIPSKDELVAALDEIGAVE